MSIRFVLAVSLLTLACAHARAQAAIDDVRTGVNALYGGVNDLTFTLEGVYADGRRTQATVELTGTPRWRCWRWSFAHSGASQAQRAVHSFDGRTYRNLQQDGLGSIETRERSSAYMSMVGIYLSNTGLAPLTAAGRTDSWTTKLAESDFTVEPDVESEGLLVVTHQRFTVRLDPSRDYVPVRVTWNAPRGGFLSDVFLEDYRQIDGFWIPHRLRDPVQNLEEVISDVSINRGIDCDDMGVKFPYGTSVLHENSKVEVYGQGSVAEAEQALQNWIVSHPVFARPQVAVGERKAPTLIAIRREHRDLAAAFFVISMAVVVAGFAVRFRRAGRVGAAVAVLALLMPGSELAAADTDTELDAQVRAAYVVASLFGSSPSLAAIDEQLRKSSASDLAAVSEWLLGEGLHTASVSMTFAELRSWEYPAIVLLRSAVQSQFPRYAVYVPDGAGGWQLIDATRYGRLGPTSDAEVAEAWVGQVLLTAPAPIRVEHAWSPVLVASIVSFAAAVVVFVVLWRVPRSAGVPRAVAMTLLMVACGACSRPDSVRDGESEAHVVLDSAEWAIADCYPGLERRHFTMRNVTGSDVTLKGAIPSCGCIAAGVPIGQVIPARGEHEFELAVDFSRARGRTHHWVRLEFSQGTPALIGIEASVRLGMFAAPESLLLTSGQPNEVLRGTIHLHSDDDVKFVISDVSIDGPFTAEIGSDRRSIAVFLVNRNEIPRLSTTLAVQTTHPRVPVVRVPIRAAFDLTWELRPASLFVRRMGEQSVVKEVTVLSRRGTPFRVMPADFEGGSIKPMSDEPAVSHRLTVKIEPNESNRAGNRMLQVRTDLPEAEQIPLSLITVE